MSFAGMLETLLGQCRNADQAMEVAVLNAQEDWGLVQLRWLGKEMVLLLVAAPNVKQCRPMVV